MITATSGGCTTSCCPARTKGVYAGNFGEKWRTRRPFAFADLGLPGRSRGELGAYLIAALPPRATADAVRFTIAKATLLRSQPRAMLPRARPVATAHSAVQPNIYYGPNIYNWLSRGQCKRTAQKMR
jgi:hypothetical protein